MFFAAANQLESGVFLILNKTSKLKINSKMNTYISSVQSIRSLTGFLYWKRSYPWHL